MTIKAIRENLEDARKGLPYSVDGVGFTVRPNQHELKLYSICEGLIVEIERLRKRVGELEP